MNESHDNFLTKMAMYSISSPFPSGPSHRFRLVWTVQKDAFFRRWRAQDPRVSDFDQSITQYIELSNKVYGRTCVLHACVHACVRVCICACLFVCVHAYVSAWVLVYIHTCVPYIIYQTPLSNGHCSPPLPSPPLPSPPLPSPLLPSPLLPGAAARHHHQRGVHPPRLLSTQVLHHCTLRRVAEPVPQPPAGDSDQEAQ